MLTSAYQHSISLLVSDLMRFNQKSRRRCKTYYCPQHFPISWFHPQSRATLLSISKSSYQYLDLLHLSCLSFSLKYFTSFSLSSPGTTSLRKRDTTTDQDLVTLGSKNTPPCTCFSLNTIKSQLPHLTSNLTHTGISFPNDTCHQAASFNLQRQKW